MLRIYPFINNVPNSSNVMDEMNILATGTLATGTLAAHATTLGVRILWSAQMGYDVRVEYKPHSLMCNGCVNPLARKN
jgi:methylglyoxal synthase